MAFLLCGFFHVSSSHLNVRNSCHTLSNWMASLQCGTYHVYPSSLTWERLTAVLLHTVHFCYCYYSFNSLEACSTTETTLRKGRESRELRSALCECVGVWKILERSGVCRRVHSAPKTCVVFAKMRPNPTSWSRFFVPGTIFESIRFIWTKNQLSRPIRSKVTYVSSWTLCIPLSYSLL